MAGGIGALAETAGGFASVKPKHKHKVVTSLQVSAWSSEGRISMPSLLTYGWYSEGCIAISLLYYSIQNDS